MIILNTQGWVWSRTVQKIIKNFQICITDIDTITNDSYQMFYLYHYQVFINTNTNTWIFNHTVNDTESYNTDTGYQYQYQNSSTMC